MKRTWIKLWVDQSLHGTLRFDMDAAERGVWYDLLLLAASCKQDGVISPGPGLTYPETWIAGTLNIPLPLLRKTLEKCVKSERISMNGDGIVILNWTKYQSEYDRQKPSREKKKLGEVDPEKFNKQKYNDMVQR